MIDCMVFEDIFQFYFSYIAVASAPALPFYQYSAQDYFYFSLCFSYITTSNQREMNPVAMTIIIFWKENWPAGGSNQQPPLLMSLTLPTELHRPCPKSASLTVQ